MPQYVVAENIGKAVSTYLLHRIQGLRGLLGQRRHVCQAGHPVVHAERKKLAPQHLGSLQEDAGGTDFTRYHLVSFREEIEVMRAASISQCRCHGVTVYTARPANTLQETGLRRRYRT